MSSKLITNRVLLILFILSISACTSIDGQKVQESESEMAIRILSSAFAEGEVIPRKYTCDAENISPPLNWSDLPEGTVSLALIMDDPDAPAGTWVHWVLYNIPPNQNGLKEGVMGAGVEGENTSGKLSYGGPYPPKGPAHRYYFKIYALDTMLDLKQGANKGEVEQAMQGYILAQGQLMGRYQR